MAIVEIPNHHHGEDLYARPEASRMIVSLIRGNSPDRELALDALVGLKELRRREHLHRATIAEIAKLRATVEDRAATDG